MKVLHVAGSFYPGLYYGGPIHTNRHLCAGLSALGVKCVVVTTDANGQDRLGPACRGWATLDGSKVFYARRWTRPDIAPSLFREFCRVLPSANVVHATGTYNWFLPLIARKCRQEGKPLVVSPHGSLMPEARNRNARKKQLYDLLLGTTALHRATGFHATSEDEAEAIKSLIPGARVTVIPNGVVVPAREESTRPAGVPQSNARYLLYMGRLHPYKQIEKIIHGFAKGTAFGGRPERGDVQGVSERVHLHPKAEVDIEHEPELWIAGDGEEDYKIALGTSARDAGVMNRVRFLGHIDGVDKSWVLAHAVAVIQAPKAENFGLVVAEALAHASPCIVGASLLWGGLRTEDCGLWVDDSPVALASAIEHFMALPEARRRAMGERGRAWMVRDFSWESVSKKTLALYEQVVQESTRGVAW